MDTAGRVDRFEALRKKSGALKQTAKPKAAKKERAVEAPKATLKDIKKELADHTVDQKPAKPEAKTDGE